jgi:hypothetical protein
MGVGTFSYSAATAGLTNRAGTSTERCASYGCESRLSSSSRLIKGRWCFGKTPTQTFLDVKPVANEKMIAACDDDRSTRHPCQIKYCTADLMAVSIDENSQIQGLDSTAARARSILKLEATLIRPHCWSSHVPQQVYLLSVTVWPNALANVNLVWSHGT